MLIHNYTTGIYAERTLFKVAADPRFLLAPGGGDPAP